MSLRDEIVAKGLELRKARSPLASTLTTLQGELDTKRKSLKEQRDLTDEEVAAATKKTVKTLAENVELYEGRGMDQAAVDARAEIELLENFLPAQMSDTDLRTFIAARIAEGGNLGQVMAALKAEKAGLYDGKAASSIARELLA